MMSWRVLEPGSFSFPPIGFSAESSSLTLNEVAGCAALLTPLLTGGMEIGLEGELGAGKTTLVRFFGAELKCREPISSPTFALCHEYRLAEPRADGLSIIEHWDLYRLSEGLAELREPVSQTSLRFVEWCERMPELGPRLNLRIQLDYANPGDDGAGGADARVMRLWTSTALAPEVRRCLGLREREAGATND